MKVRWLLLAVFLFLFGQTSFVWAKDEVWKDKNEDFSTWKKVIVVELQLPVELEEDKLIKNVLEDEWDSEFLEKIKSKHIEKIPFTEALIYLEKQNSQVSWRGLWEEDQERFFKEASPYWQNYADGILVSKITDYKKETRWKEKRRGGLLGTIGIGVNIPVGKGDVSVGTSGSTGSSGVGGKQVVTLTGQSELQLFDLNGNLKWMCRTDQKEENKEMSSLFRKIFQAGGRKFPL